MCCRLVQLGRAPAEAAGEEAGSWEQRVQRQKSAPAGSYRALPLGRQNTGPGAGGLPAPFGRTVCTSPAHPAASSGESWAPTIARTTLKCRTRLSNVHQPSVLPLLVTAGA